jgi:hypothetical protein
MASVGTMSSQTRAIVTALTGILILVINVIDAAQRGSSVWNFVAIACGAFLVFYGFTGVARSGRPPSDG